jgi:DNA/RNA endonuclease G (NUC1)
LVSRVGQLYVVSGPLYERAKRLAVEEGMLEPPSKYFKVVATSIAYAAFIFPAELPIHAEYCAQFASIDKIQELSGLSLFPDLEKELGPELFQELRCDP